MTTPKTSHYILNASDRAIANWEAGAPISSVYAAKLVRLREHYKELKQLMKSEEIGPGLVTETDEFEGRTPPELISKAESGNL
jgi:hypothetical protein